VSSQASTAKPDPVQPRRKGTSVGAAARRAERLHSTRRKLLDAAARIIGQHGYANCSVARVTRKARIAHGTFYLYFQSQQELFDTLLPTLGLEMLDEIAQAVGNASDPMEVERLGFTANVKYTSAHLYMNRVLYEAQVFSPEGYAAYFSQIYKGYVRSLQRTLKHGQFSGASEAELTLVARMIVSARMGLTFRITRETAGIPGFLDELVETYLKFVCRGLDP
jgi:AcrR family transcriptional regulator